MERHFAHIGEQSIIDEQVILGYRYQEHCEKARIGRNCVVRAFSVIYADVMVGDHVKTGHHVVVREHTIIGNQVVIGSGAILEDNIRIGDRVKIESNVYIPSHTTIGSDVFIGPSVVMTNDKYPQRRRDEYEPAGPHVQDSVSIGANATLLPGVVIGEGSFIAAGAVVTKNVPPWSLVKGNPGKVQDLPENLRERNKAKVWR
jgi:acetyltransferase-like isoleucine patch superfamily enzyme